MEAQEKREPLLLHLQMPFRPAPNPLSAKSLYSMENTDLVRSYLQAMEKEILACEEDSPSFEVKALHVGGGIAGHLADEELGNLLKKIRSLFLFSPKAELSLRVHPGMVSVTTLEMCKRAGIQKLCMDYVTSSPYEAEIIERFLPPSAMDVSEMILKPSGLHLSFDIIVGLPGQSQRSLVATLEKVFHYEAKEIVVHPLLIQSGSRFEKVIYPLCKESSSPRKHLPEGEEKEELLSLAKEWLSREGYEECLPGRFSLEGSKDIYHELEQKKCSLMGFGLGAKSRMDGFLSLNTFDMKTYLEGSPDPSRLVQVVWKEE